MDRHPHFLKPNKSTELPSNAIFLDTETKPHPLGPLRIAHRLDFGWAAHQRTIRGGEWSQPSWGRFQTPSQLWDWAESKLRPRIKLYLFAHNWAFDGPVLDAFQQLPQRGWTLQQAVIDSPPVILTWRRDTSTLIMLDTLNWWRMSLAQIGESVSLPKLPFPPAAASTVEKDTYCRRDVEVIRRTMHSWWKLLADHDLGGFAPTLAGQSLRAFRHRFMRHQILIDSDGPSLELARASYHGGRVECYRIGRIEGPIHLFDVNSMYPHVMATRDYPTVVRTHCRNPSLDELDRWSRDYACVADVQIETDSPQYAVVRDGKLIFPVGRFSAKLTTPDIRAALDQGHAHGATEVSVYDKAPLFATFVREMYELRAQARDQGDDVGSWLVKILLNSLYGKFGQRGIKWNVIGKAPDDGVRTYLDVDVCEGITYKMRQFAGILQQQEETPESANSHPAIAAHITAYARRYLWDLMELAGRRNVLYCDTDSLYVTRAGSDRLAARVSPGELGALKREGTCDWLQIHGPKDYATPEKSKTKGVRAKATWLDSNTVEQEQWCSLVGLLGLGQLSEPVTMTIRKTLRREYTKGTVLPSGQVKPFRLEDW